MCILTRSEHQRMEIIMEILKRDEIILMHSLTEACVFVKEYIKIIRISIRSHLFGSIVVNLSCKNSHYYTVQEEHF